MSQLEEAVARLERQLGEPVISAAQFAELTRRLKVLKEMAK